MRETESNRILDAKCQEYMNQLEKSAQNFEEFKKKMFEQNNNHSEEVTMMQEKITNLTDRLNDKEKEFEDLLEENASVKRKLNYEVSSKSRIQEEKEEIQRRFDEINRTQRDKDGQYSQQDDEIMRLKKQLDSAKDEVQYLKTLEEKLTANLKDANASNRDLTDKNSDLIKMNEDKDQQLNMLRLELDNLNNQMGSSGKQYRDLLSENESLKKDALQQKEVQLETENELRNISLHNEKIVRELNQLKDALFRTEQALERERRKAGGAPIDRESSPVQDQRSRDQVIQPQKMQYQPM